VCLMSPTTFRFQHELVAVCDPSVGGWSSWNATARTRPIAAVTQLAAKTFVKVYFLRRLRLSRRSVV